MALVSAGTSPQAACPFLSPHQCHPAARQTLDHRHGEEGADGLVMASAMRENASAVRTAEVSTRCPGEE